MKEGLQENEPGVVHAPFVSSGPYHGHRISMAHLSCSIKNVCVAAAFKASDLVTSVRVNGPGE